MSSVRLNVFALGAIALVGCGSSSNGGADAQVAGKMIDATGGTIMSSDHSLVVTIPPDAVTTPIMITVTPTTQHPTGTVGTVYDIGPTGTQFATPIALRFEVPNGYQPSQLTVVTVVGGATTPDGTPEFDATTVTGHTSHLSLHAMATRSGQMPDAGPLPQDGPAANAL